MFRSDSKIGEVEEVDDGCCAQMLINVNVSERHAKHHSDLSACGWCCLLEWRLKCNDFWGQLCGIRDKEIDVIKSWGGRRQAARGG